MTYYPLPNETGFVGLGKYANTVTNYTFGNGVLLVLFFLFFLGLKYRNNSTGESILASLAATTIINVPLYIFGWTADYTVGALIALTAISTILVWRYG